LIPQDTTSLYTAKGYPSDLLQEAGDTPVPDSIDLTGTKSILSYADSESSVLTATVLAENKDPIEGVDVNLYNGSTLWDTLTTGSDGTVSKTYTSQGSGDIVFTAEVDGTLLTKTFKVRDGIFYDVSSSSNVSKYGDSSAFSYDSTEQAYYITTSSVKNITRESIKGDFDFEISMDFKMPSTTCNFYCGESTTGYECQGQIIGASIVEKGIRTYYTNSSQSVTGRQTKITYTFDTNKWYTYKVTRVGNVLTAQVLDGDTVIATATDNNVTGTNNNISWHNYVASGQLYWKNILFIRL
jgi:hypothetical protein